MYHAGCQERRRGRIQCIDRELLIKSLVELMDPMSPSQIRHCMDFSTYDKNVIFDVHWVLAHFDIMNVVCMAVPGTKLECKWSDLKFCFEQALDSCGTDFFGLSHSEVADLSASNLTCIFKHMRSASKRKFAFAEVLKTLHHSDAMRIKRLLSTRLTMCPSAFREPSANSVSSCASSCASTVGYETDTLDECFHLDDIDYTDVNPQTFDCEPDVHVDDAHIHNKFI